MDALESELTRRQQAGLYRVRRTASAPQGVQTIIDGKAVISFCGNDYLGLANHPDIKKSFIEAVERFGVGSGAAHLINGHSQLHEDCEQRLAEFTGRSSALLFSTGYMANLAIANTLAGSGDVIFQDKLNHASLIDGARISDARLVRFPHLDLSRLRSQLEQHQTSARKLIMTDGVFSMDGDTADLPALAELSQRHDSWLMVDDAHGFGVLGDRGAGLVEQENLGQEQVPVLMATLGKAVGTAGAFVAGSQTLIETLIQQARTYIYTTATPPAIAAATLKSIDIVESESWRREKLQELIAHFKEKIGALDCELMSSQTAIQPIVIGDNHRTLELSQSLFERGLHVTAIRPPTVPAGSARLRVTLSAEHDIAHVDHLVKALKALL
ncbi:MAG: 8-amino-7-oxononanoate synthase [Pseudomonadota bacterium]